MRNLNVNLKRLFDDQDAILNLYGPHLHLDHDPHHPCDAKQEVVIGGLCFFSRVFLMLKGTNQGIHRQVSQSNRFRN